MSTTSDTPGIRVLVVDDSPFMRKAIQRMLTTAPGIEVIGTAASGEAALEAIEMLVPDVVTLDVVLPGADGITVLERIMSRHPLPVLMLSSLTTRDAETTLIALEKGAVDVVAKPVGYTHMDMPLIAEELVAKVRSAAGVDASMLQARQLPATQRQRTSSERQLPQTSELEALVIGASTGGPPALSTLLSQLPGDLRVPVLIVQHMPAGFTAAFAERLDRSCPLQVKEAADGDVFKAGSVYVAKSGRHVKFVRRPSRTILRLGLNPPGLTHVPSIDVAMRSAAETFGARAMGVLLTGMGDDGARGLLRMRESGAYTIAESEDSAIIWGMPRVAMEMGAAVTVAPISEMPDLIMDRIGSAGVS